MHFHYHHPTLLVVESLRLKFVVTVKFRWLNISHNSYKSISGAVTSLAYHAPMVLGTKLRCAASTPPDPHLYLTPAHLYVTSSHATPAPVRCDRLALPLLRFCPQIRGFQCLWGSGVFLQRSGVLKKPRLLMVNVRFSR